ncbi:phage tail protein [Sporosarcina sp. FA9]|uniref:phage tail protein n=1 Tax=Sporosarcina sp. FA9 TaxID=3413030 RepID=UPI003F65CC80
MFIDNSDADKSISKTGDKADGLGTKLGAGIKTAAKWGAAIGAGALAAGAGMYKMATSSAETTDRIDKLSQKIGMSRDGFQEWDFIMSQSGGSVEQLQMGFKTMVNSIDQAVAGSGKGADSFKKLGISVKDANGQVKDQETVFNEAVIALQGMEEGTEKAKLANDLFGRSGAEMMPLLNGAAGSVEDMKKQAHDLGLILGDDAIDAGVAFTDTIDQLQRSFQTAIAAIGVQFMPMITKFADFIIANMPTIQAVIGTVFGVISDVIGVAVEWLSKAIDAIGDVVTSISEWAGENTELLNRIKESFMSLFDGIKEGFGTVVEWVKKFGTLVKENADIVIPAIVGMVAVIIGSMVPAWIASATAAIASAAATALAFLPVTLAIALVGVVIAGLALIWRKWGDDITRITKTVVEAVVTWFKDMSEKISVVVKAISEGVKVAFNHVKDNISASLELAKKIISTVLDYWKNTFNNVMAFLKALVSGDFEGMKNAIKAQMENASGLITTIWNAIKTFFGTILKSLVALVGDQFQEIVRKVKEKMDNVLTAISGGFSDALSFIKGVGTDFFNAGANIIGMVADGIKSAVGKVTGAISNVMSKVRDFLPFSPAKVGPLKTLNKLDFGGPISDSIEDAIPEVSGMMAKLFNLPKLSLLTPILSDGNQEPGEIGKFSPRTMPSVIDTHRSFNLGKTPHNRGSGSNHGTDEKMAELIKAIYSLAYRPQVLRVDGKTIAESSYKDISRMMMRDIKQTSRAMAMDW